MIESIYLSGAMEYAGNDFGLEWRKEFAKKCKQKCIIPEMIAANSPPKSDFEGFAKHIRPCIDDDVESVAKCSRLFVLWTNECSRGAGTAGEMTLAYYLKKPVDVVFDQAHVFVPGWIFGLVTQRFSTVQDAIEWYNKQ